MNLQQGFRLRGAVVHSLAPGVSPLACLSPVQLLESQGISEEQFEESTTRADRVLSEMIDTVQTAKTMVGSRCLY